MYEVAETELSEAREQAVRAELDRLLDSAAFRTSKRCREFLKYVVEHTIHGPNGALKERAIGVELFQLPEDFDTGQHTIVRVTANEVRKKLAQHYPAENGSHHAVRIDLPPGSYSAEFRWETPPAEAHAPKRAPKRLSPALIACLAAALAVAGVFFLLPNHAMKRVTVDAKSTPVPDPFPKTPSSTGSFRMIVGSTSSYTDRSGQTWGPDRFFSGGSVLVRPSERIFRTLDPDIYRHVRTGDFRYDIPLALGSYELHLLLRKPGWPILSARSRVARGSACFGSPRMEDGFWITSM